MGLSRVSPDWCRPDSCRSGARPAFLPLLLAAVLSAPILTAPPPAFAQGSSPPRTVKVSRGDTLDGIAQRFGVSAAEIKRLNGLKDADLLQVGQILRLPSPPPPKGQVVVTSGDTLESIAKANNTTTVALQQANPGIQPGKLRIGSTLRLPTATGAASPPGRPAPAARSAAPRPPAPPAGQPPAPQPSPAQPPPTVETVQPTAAQLSPPVEGSRTGRWRYYGDTVVDWGGWKRMAGGVRYTLVQPSARDVGEARAQATAIAVDCSTLRQTWRVKETWEAWSNPAPRSVGQQIVLDLCGNAPPDDRRPVPAPPLPGT